MLSIVTSNSGSRAQMRCEIEGSGLLGINQVERSENVVVVENIEDRKIKTGVVPVKRKGYLVDLEFVIYESLNGVPLRALKKCPECERTFLHTTQIKKMYCSNRCAARAGVREKRQKIKQEGGGAYEKALRSGAMRAKKSYNASVPYGTPASQPRKHKPEED